MSTDIPPSLAGATCFSGIGCAEVGLPQISWRWSAETDDFANAVRTHRHPADRNLGDVLADDFIDRAVSHGPIDVLIGGSPCQDFSTQGLKAGLSGARGALTIRWLEIIHAIKPLWAVTENVSGWLHSNRGHAFGAFLAGLVGHDTALLPPRSCGGRWTDAGLVAGPGGCVAWRILDAKYFGLPQCRRRVFVVFCSGNRRDPAEILFEPQSRAWHPAQACGEIGTPASGAAGCVAALSSGAGRADATEGQDAVPAIPDGVSCADLTPPLTRQFFGDHISRTDLLVVTGDGVRRLTPLETERCQGLPDGYTKIPWGKGVAPDGLRYRAVGNGFAIAVIKWLGERIIAAETSIMECAL